MKRFIMIALLPVLAQAAELPESGPEDPRIRTVVYDPSQVVVIKGHAGFEGKSCVLCHDPHTGTDKNLLRPAAKTK